MTYQEFKERFHIRLNPQQESAVRRTEGPVLLLAVPGSGKTTVLVTRLGYLLYCKGVPPGKILTVTYTVAAAGDMARRFEALFGGEHAGRLAFRTINGLCATVIHTYARKKGASPFELVTSDAQLNGAVRDILIRAGADYPTELQIKDARTQITFCKNQMLTDAEIQNIKVDGMDFSALYTAYQAYLKQNRLMDYDDQMVFAYRILRQHPDLLAYYQRKYRYLCVDEAQDTSKIQHAILRLLASEHRNLFMVGDEDQSIYGFRAAWPQALLAFEQTWPGAAVLLMETNYRSTRAIVEQADAFIQRNQDRHAKHMRTDNPPGEPIRKIVLTDYNRQYNYLLKVAQDCQKPTAVLFRNNDSALPIIDLLDREGVPFSCRQREGFFFSSPVVRDLTEILEFAFDGCSREPFLRFYYKLDLKMKKAVLTNLLRYQQEGDTVFDTLLESETLEPWQIGRIRAMQTHFSKLPQLSSFAALQRIVRFMGYGDYLKEQRMDASKLDVLLALANQTPDLRAFLLRLRELREMIAAGFSSECPLVLSTIHASKGLEYDRVLLIDVVDGVFPALSEPDSQDLSPEDRAALEEERRLFYVYYVCSAHKQDKSCQPHRIRDTELEDMVLAALQSYISQVVDLDALLDATDTVPLRTAEVRKLQRRLDACKAELERANRLLLSLYENLTDGIISREEYNLLKQNYSKRTSDAERQMNDLQDAIRSVQEKDRCGQSWIGQFRKHENLTELERATVVTLIDRILVYAGKQVEIRYRWQDEFAWQLDLLRQTRAKEAV